MPILRLCAYGGGSVLASIESEYPSRQYDRSIQSFVTSPRPRWMRSHPSLRSQG